MIHEATIRVGPVDWWHPGGDAERCWDVWFGAPDRWRIEGEPDPAAFGLPEGVTVQTAADEQAARRRDAGVDPVPLDVRVHQVEPWGPRPADPAAADAAVTAAFRDDTATDPFVARQTVAELLALAGILVPPPPD